MIKIKDAVEKIRTSKYKFFFAIAVIVLVLAVILAINLTLNQKPNSEDGYRFVIAVCQQNLETFEELTFKNDIEKRAISHPDVNILFYSAGGNLERQALQIEEALAFEPNCIIASCDEPEALEKSFAVVRERGIKLVATGTSGSVAVSDVMIRTDYYDIGRQIAKFAANKKLGPVFLEVQSEARTAKARELQSGFRSIIESYPEILSPYIVVGKSTYTTAQKRIVESGMLSVSPSVNSVFAHSDETLLGAARAFGKKNSPKIIGVCVSSVKSECLRELAASSITAVAAIPSGGSEAFDCALGLLNGSPVNEEYVLPIKVLTSDDAAKYLREMEEQK